MKKRNIAKIKFDQNINLDAWSWREHRFSELGKESEDKDNDASNSARIA